MLDISGSLEVEHGCQSWLMFQLMLIILCKWRLRSDFPLSISISADDFMSTMYIQEISLLHLSLFLASSSSRNLSVILVLDLSSPNELWFTLETFLKELRQYIDAAITAARRDDPNIKNKLKEKTWERIGADHAVSFYKS